MAELVFSHADVLKHVISVRGQQLEFTMAGEYSYTSEGFINVEQEDSQVGQKPIGRQHRPGKVTTTLSNNRSAADFDAIFGAVGMTVTTTFASGLKIQLFGGRDISDADSHARNQTTGTTGELTYSFSQSTVTGEGAS